MIRFIMVNNFYLELSGKSGTFPSRRFVYDSSTITDESYIDGMFHFTYGTKLFLHL